MEELAKHLSLRSKEICIDNGCTEEGHNCESYAYLSYTYNDGTDSYEGVQLLDICASDFFQGCSRDHMALPLPFEGDAKDLMQAIARYDDSF